MMLGRKKKKEIRRRQKCEKINFWEFKIMKKTRGRQKGRQKERNKGRKKKTKKENE